MFIVKNIDNAEIEYSNSSGWNLEWCSQSGRSLAAIQKVKYRVTIWHCNSSLRYIITEEKCEHMSKQKLV